MILRDQLGFNHDFTTSPQRIISLVPSITETLIDLGLEEQIVGITKFCVHPFYIKSTKTIVGGTKQVHYDKIDELQPDIIIVNKEENTKEIVEVLKQKYVVWITEVATIDDCFQMIQDFGIIFNKRTQSKKWIEKIQFSLSEFQNYIATKEFIKVAYFIWANPYMVAGSNTFINEMLQLNHFNNVYANNPKYVDRYPEVIIQKMRIQGDPDYVLLSSEPFPFKDEHAFEIGRHTHHAKTVFVDGEMFSWFGTRLLKSINYFRELNQVIR